MKAVFCAETPIEFYQTTRRYISADFDLHRCVTTAHSDALALSIITWQWTGACEFNVCLLQEAFIVILVVPFIFSSAGRAYSVYTLYFYNSVCN
jgi:hypothetical protein